jgi:hypothetical protein
MWLAALGPLIEGAEARLAADPLGIRVGATPLSGLASRRDYQAWFASGSGK